MLLEEMSDEDLIFLINSGSKLAEKVFYVRYARQSHAVAKEYFEAFKDSGISEEDFYAVIFAKTYDAFISFNSKTVEKTFYKYWRAVIKNAVYDYVRINSYQIGARPLGDTSFDDIAFINNENLMLHDTIGENETDNQILELIKSYVESDSEFFTYEEKALLRLLIYEENTIQEVSDNFDIPRNHINYLIRCIREKTKKIIKDNYL